MNGHLCSRGLQLDASPDCLGPLKDSSVSLNDTKTLREIMEEDGYLFIRDLLPRDLVCEARKELTRRLLELGLLDPDASPFDALPNKNVPHKGFHPDLAKNNPPLERILYSGEMIQFYERFLGGKILHFNFTWLRAIGAGGMGTYPHADVVYMGRGTQNLFTAWVPLGDITYSIGGLMILEQSHRKGDQIREYLNKDVDSYCENSPDAEKIRAGIKKGQWTGSLSEDPVALRKELGGRWLTTEYSMGDVLTFPIHTVHASLDNTSDRIRLSSDSRYQLASEPADERWVGDHPIGHGLAGKKGRIC